MHWYNKRHWSYFSHAYFAQGKKAWPFTLLTAVVSTLGSMAPTGRPWCACWVRWGCIIVVSPRGRILMSKCCFFHSYHSNSKLRKGKERGRQKKVGTLALVNTPKMQLLFRCRGHTNVPVQCMFKHIGLNGFCCKVCFE